jgi:tetratricopeptide (TPR) repeat protein
MLEAVKIINQQSTLDPEDRKRQKTEILINMAILCRNSGQIDKALDYLEKAVNLARSLRHDSVSFLQDAMYNTIIYLEELKHYARALEVCAEYAKLVKPVEFDEVKDAHLLAGRLLLHSQHILQT